MLLPPSLSTRCLIRPETKHVPRAQPSMETSVLGQTVSGHFEARPGNISVAGRAGWAAGLWGGRKERKPIPVDDWSAPAGPQQPPWAATGCSSHDRKPQTTSCKFLYNVYCKSYFSESPLQSSSVLHIQHLLQNTAKNNWFTSRRQMAIKYFSIFLYSINIKLRGLSSIYILCYIKSIENTAVKKLMYWNTPSEEKLKVAAETMPELLLRHQWTSIAQKLNRQAKLNLLWGPFYS